MVDLILRGDSAAARARGYVACLLMVATSVLLGLIVAPRWGNSAVDLLFIPAVLAAAAMAGLGPGLLAAIGSALAYNFFFTAPHLTFRISDPNDLVTVVILFGVAVVASQLAAAIRRQANLARANADRNATIAGFARRLLGSGGHQDIADVTVNECARIFHCNAILVEAAEPSRVAAAAPAPMTLNPSDTAAVALAIAAGDRTGRGVDRSVPTEWQFHPIKAGQVVLAALGIARDDGSPAVRTDQMPLLDNLLDQIALALERSRLESDARKFSRVRERDRIRSALLSTIGQDLQPSLDAVSRSVRALRRDASTDKALVSELASETARLDRYLSNLAALGVQEDQEPLIAGDIAIDLFRRTVTVRDTPVHLTPKEYAVLAELAKHPGRVLGHAHLLRTAWGPAQEGNAEYLRVAVRGLRQKLEADPSRPAIILNEPSVGYRLQAPEQAGHR
jgi:two-component system sensor histidine kinase KdpD